MNRQVEHLASPAGDMLQFSCQLIVDELFLMQFFANIKMPFFRPVNRQVEHVASPAGDMLQFFCRLIVDELFLMQFFCYWQVTCCSSYAGSLWTSSM